MLVLESNAHMAVTLDEFPPLEVVGLINTVKVGRGS